MASKFQYRTAEMGQVVDVDIVAVKAAMDIYDVSNPAKCMEMTRKLFHYFRRKNDAGG